MTKPRTLRCAIYTRKSSEEGLEQDFNSLHAQRDACEAYVLSQAGEGWTALPTAYDDGGISGGTMERPGLMALLADIAARKVDVVVVYKVDRLTRSLADFARIVEVFDRNQVSFVSVTQSFNTTSSMGRLTLNMLLSFAQFEREVTSERIRDKIAASKKKGMWMGGNLPLGYDADGRTLKINEAEAETVRHIFRRYIDLKSVHVLADELRDQSIRSKRRQTKAGAWIGGEVFTRGALFHLLTNRVYLGMVPHKKEAYPGLHKAILDQDLFDQVQQALASNRHRRHGGRQGRASSSLVGKVFDAEGRPMTPTFTKRPNGRIYRYYVSGWSQRQRIAAGKPKPVRLCAPPLEAAIASAVGTMASFADIVLERVDVGTMDVALWLIGVVTPRQFEVICREASNFAPVQTDTGVKIVMALPAPARGGARLRFGDLDNREDAHLTGALRRGHSMLHGNAPNFPDIRLEKAPQSPYEFKVSRLAFLAPELQRAILSDDLALRCSLEAFLAESPPLSWQQQREWIRERLVTAKN